MNPLFFEASVIRDDECLSVWVTASVSPRLVFDALDDYWEQDTASIDDCTDESGGFLFLTVEERRELEQTAIRRYYAREAAEREACEVAREDCRKYQSAARFPHSFIS